MIVKLITKFCANAKIRQIANSGINYTKKFYNVGTLAFYIKKIWHNYAIISVTAVKIISQKANSGVNYVKKSL
jgi:hypothetical protein